MSIPSDILIVAKKLVGPPTAISQAGCDAMVFMIANALIGERERCAAIAENHFPTGRLKTQKVAHGTCLAIADKIRAQS